MGRPKTRWAVARVALFELGRGATVGEAATAAGLSVATVLRLVVEHGVMPLPSAKPRVNALTVGERERILIGVTRGDSDAVITRDLGCHRGTIKQSRARACACSRCRRSNDGFPDSSTRSITSFASPRRLDALPSSAFSFDWGGIS
jgi:hypothetical protein